LSAEQGIAFDPQPELGHKGEVRYAAKGEERNEELRAFKGEQRVGWGER